MFRHLDSKKWSHFRDREFLESLAQNREDLVVVGPPRCGKSELVRDLFGPSDPTRINCLIFDNFAKLTADFCDKIARLRQPGLAKPPASFAHLLHFLSISRNEDLGGLTTVVFENAHVLLDISYDGCADFFRVYSRFTEEAANFLDFHTVVVSKCELPVDYFKVALPYPDKEKLSEFVGQRFDARCEQVVLDETWPFLCRMRQSFIATVLEFDIIVHDFDSFDLLTSKLFSELKRDVRSSIKNIAESKSHFGIRTFPGVNHFVQIFFFNIKAIYYPNKELREMKKNFEAEDKATQNYGIFNSIAHMHKKMLENMPTVACYILLSCYIASSIPQSKDHTVLGICKQKINSKRAFQKQLKHKAFSTARAVSIVEVLMENSRDRDQLNEHGLLHHSAEFYMIFDFFERIGWLKESGVGQVPKYYKFVCDPSFISVLIRKLGLEQSEFFFHGNP